MTLLPIGAYHAAWPDIHMNPEDAVRAHLDVDATGRACWCRSTGRTFRLAPHPWAEPVERLLAAADADGCRVAVPRPGRAGRPDDAVGVRPVVAVVTATRSGAA